MILQVKEKEKLIKFLIHNVQGLSFSSAQKLIRLGKVKINGKRVKNNIDLNVFDELEIFNLISTKPNIEVIYEDENIIIVNKPQGVECATRDKSSPNTYSLEELFSDKNAIVVHRLDRLTEGLVILAKTKEIARKFEQYFKNRKITKKYITCVYGEFKNSGIDIKYLHKDNQKSKVIVSNEPKDDYKKIITEFKVLKQINNKTLIEIILHTGRTHQIRAHLSFLGYPIVNDNKYNNTKSNNTYKYQGYFLTAYKLEFNLDDDLKYLNGLEFSITPSWLKYLNE